MSGRDERDVIDSELARIRRERKAREATKAKANGASGTDAEALPIFSDEALALRFAERHAGKLRYVSFFGRWFSWNGTRWCRDDTLHAFDLARAICREAAASCNKRSTATTLSSAKTVAAVERLAKADRRLAATTDQWDLDPWLLNTPGGVVDLRTGETRPGRPEDYMTKITAVAPGGECPMWHAFMDRITGGNTELAEFLQRVLGYGLTGITREHALFFMHGSGANGKGVLLNTVGDVMGDYHVTTGLDTFTASKTDHHPTDLANLQGGRLVTVPETEKGRFWAEAKIKTLTGGDKISARFMRQDFFEYTPQFKLIIAGNHKPSLNAVDEAIRRRMHLVPFLVTIPPDERDPDFAEKLKVEWPGILAWMIEGCLQWQRQKLAPPDIVCRATEAYLQSEDAVGSWLEDCCERDPQAWENSTIAFASWASWATRAGEPVGSLKAFSAALEARFAPKRRRDGRGFNGLRVIQQAEQRQARWEV